MAYTIERKLRAIEDLETIYRCADVAGIRHAVFIGFGTCLGIVRNGDFIDNDDDTDMCVLADRISAQQEAVYFDMLARNNMFFGREKVSVRCCEDGLRCDWYEIGRRAKRGFSLEFKERKELQPHRLTWFTLRRRPENNKFCHWLMFPWSGYYWHTKSGRWVTHRKFDPAVFGYDPSTDDAIMKGIPQRLLNQLLEIDWYGHKVNIPKLYGGCLDHWYPGWRVPMKMKSTKEITCRVPDWMNERTWKIRLI